MPPTIVDEGRDYLAHFGVLGMKWGVRKKKISDRVYSEKDSLRDQAIYGTNGTRRIVKRIEKGSSIGTARRREYVRQVAPPLAVIAGGFFAKKAIKEGRNFLARNPQFYTKTVGPAITQTTQYATGFKVLNAIVQNGDKVRVLIPKT